MRFDESVQTVRQEGVASGQKLLDRYIVGIICETVYLVYTVAMVVFHVVIPLVIVVVVWVARNFGRHFMFGHYIEDLIISLHALARANLYALLRTNL